MTFYSITEPDTSTMTTQLTEDCRQSTLPVMLSETLTNTTISLDHIHITVNLNLPTTDICFIYRSPNCSFSAITVSHSVHTLRRHAHKRLGSVTQQNCNRKYRDQKTKSMSFTCVTSEEDFSVNFTFVHCDFFNNFQLPSSD